MSEAVSPTVSESGSTCGRALGGIQVIEFGIMVAGPSAGQVLADLGADVIKVEALEGDIVRTVPPLHNGVSGAFAQWNRNKRSIAIDLRSDEGRDIVYQLACRADVLLQSFRPGVVGRMGLTFARLREDNPRLIYTSVNGYGDDGPYADQPAYDLVAQGLTGFMPVQGGTGDPVPVKSAIVDKITGYSAAMAIMAALVHRSTNGGRGQYINVNMINAYSAFMLPEQMYNYAFPELPRADDSAGVNNLYNVVCTRDGHVVGMVASDSQFQGLMDALDRPDLSNDPRFATPSGRMVHDQQLKIAIAPQAAELTTAEFIERMRAHHVPFAPVNDMAGFLADPQVIHNRGYVDRQDPVAGTIRTTGAFARFSETPARPEGAAPTLGQHTDLILSELGFPHDRIEALRARSIIG